MKKYLKSILCIILVLAIGAPAVFSADVDTAAPYNGEYVFLYNSGASAETIGSLPGIDFAQNSSESGSIPEGTVRVDERENETLYCIEPSFEETEYPAVMLFSADDDYRAFTLTDVANNTAYASHANKLYEDDYCKIYVEEDQISEADEKTIAENLAAEFANIISHIRTNVCDFSEKITILVHDIRDAYYYGNGNAYVGGYFNSGEYLTEKMIHIDLFPLMGKDKNSDLKPENAYSTLAHEFTHLVEYSVNGTNDNLNDMWLSELFALASERALYTDKSDYERYGSFISDYSDIIKNGAVLNYSEYTDNNSDISANYGLLYAFASYIGTRYGENVFKSILTASVDAESSEAALLEGINDESLSSFGDIIRDFYMAVILNEESGIYKLAESNRDYLINMPFNISGSISLKPGAAVVVPLFNEEFSPSELGENILYTVFSSDDITEMSKLSFEYGKVTTVSKSIMPAVNPNIDGENLIDAKANINTSLFNKLIFISNKDYAVFAKSGRIISKNPGKVTVRCQSLTDRSLFCDFEITVDISKTAVNYIAGPNSESGLTVQITNFNPDYKTSSSAKLYIAVYDTNGGLADVKSVLLPGINGNGIMSIPLDTLFSGIESGEYKVKLFIFKADGSLIPASRSFEIDWEK